MSTPMYDIPEHFPMPINAAGQGPEMDPEKVIRTICWSCLPAEDWPCQVYRSWHQAWCDVQRGGKCSCPNGVYG